MEINGLYSYGGKKSRIDFGGKTLIVGPNNSGKSSIFKALDFFLRSLTEYTDRNSGPWRGQNKHEMTVMFELNVSERWYVAEVLLINNTEGMHTLAQMKTVGWLACRLKNITLTIRWRENQFSPMSYHPQYILHLDDLGITINSDEYNSNVWVAKEDTERQRSPIENKSFGSVMEEGPLSQDSLKNKLVSLLEQQSLVVIKVPVLGYLNSRTLTVDEKNRIRSLRDMSKNHIPNYNKEYPFFLALGRMLQPKFAFVSEQRRFSDSNDLEKTPLKEDGSNLHSFLFWLKNGDSYEQKAYAVIQDKFKKIHGLHGMTFSISITEKQTTEVQQNPEPARNQIYTVKVVISSPDTSGQKHRSVDFAHVGAGIKESLFLLSSCFGRKDKVILMDEPAVNLHPTLIKRLMHEILTPGGQAESGQIAVITHSPTMASLEMLSSANKINRVDRHDEYSEIVQPSKKDEEWISKHLATFHLLKPDVLFSHRVILVEGESDKIFVETILNLCAKSASSNADYIVVNVYGKHSFEKFQKFMDIFKINFVIVADDDAKKMFESEDAEALTINSLSQNNNSENKTIYILEKNLEYLLACLDQKTYNEYKQRYQKKPELSYHFTSKLLKENHKAIQTELELIAPGEQQGTLPTKNREVTQTAARIARLIRLLLGFQHRHSVIGHPDCGQDRAPNRRHGR